jgi:iron complex transport system ATP-binding protein
MLELQDAAVRLGGRPALDGASLQVGPGEVVGVVGPNGAGKTTLIRAALGLVPLDRGAARLGGEPVARLDPRRRAERVAYLPQDRRVAWGLPAWRIAALGAPFASPENAGRRAREALTRVGLEALSERSVFDMSGGERARVLLARLLVTGAPLLLADEPVAGLDPDAQLAALELLTEEARRGAGVLLTLHDLSLAVRACDRLVVLDRGRVVAEGAPAEALTPGVLAAVFALEGAVRDTPEGPVVAARRRRRTA